jgi:hypothetical protein
LAVIVDGPRNVGRFVNVLQESQYGPGWWWVESASGPLLGAYRDTSEIGCGMAGNIEDRRLRPIRDPGDDAVDETLQWVGAPKPAERSVWTPKPQREHA